MRKRLWWRSTRPLRSSSRRTESRAAGAIGSVFSEPIQGFRIPPPSDDLASSGRGGWCGLRRKQEIHVFECSVHEETTSGAYKRRQRRTDHDVIGETHSLLTPLSVRLRGNSPINAGGPGAVGAHAVRRTPRPTGQRTDTARVACADPLRPARFLESNGIFVYVYEINFSLYVYAADARPPRHPRGRPGADGRESCLAPAGAARRRGTGRPRS